MTTMTKSETGQAIPRLSKIDNALADAGMSPEQITPILQRVKHHDELVAALSQAIAYVERTIAHRGAMSKSDIDREVSRIQREVSQVTTAHNSADVGVTFDLAAARAALAKVTT